MQTRSLALLRRTMPVWSMTTPRSCATCDYVPIGHKPEGWRCGVCTGVEPPTDSQAQQAWWESMTDEQREAYEDAIERERAERDVDVKVCAILARDNVTEPGGEWSIYDVAGQLDPNARNPSWMFDTGPDTLPRDEYVEQARASIRRIDPPARDVGGTSKYLYHLPRESEIS